MWYTPITTIYSKIIMIYVIYSTNCSSYNTTILTIVVNYIYNFYYFFPEFQQRGEEWDLQRCATGHSRSAGCFCEASGTGPAAFAVTWCCRFAGDILTQTWLKQGNFTHLMLIFWFRIGWMQQFWGKQLGFWVLFGTSCVSNPKVNGGQEDDWRIQGPIGVRWKAGKIW